MKKGNTESIFSHRSMTTSVLCRNRSPLGQNYPNPFNPTTTIPFVINKAGNVTIEIFSITGQRICTLINEYRPSGIQSVFWDALDDRGVHVGAGVYLYRLRAEGKSETKKMLLMDGGARALMTGASSASMPSPWERAKISSPSWSVKITGDEISPHIESNRVFTDGKTYNFSVMRLSPITFVSIPGGDVPDGSGSE